MKTYRESMNEQARRLDHRSKARFYDHRGVKNYNRIWEPSVGDYSGKASKQ